MLQIVHLHLVLAGLARGWCHYAAHTFAKLVHFKWIVSPILILPSEVVFALVLLPELLEELVVVDKIVAGADLLQNNALPTHSHCVAEVLLLPIVAEQSSGQIGLGGRSQHP